MQRCGRVTHGSTSKLREDLHRDRLALGLEPSFHSLDPSLDVSVAVVPAWDPSADEPETPLGVLMRVHRIDVVRVQAGGARFLLAVDL